MFESFNEPIDTTPDSPVQWFLWRAIITMLAGFWLLAVSGVL